MSSCYGWCEACAAAREKEELVEQAMMIHTNLRTRVRLDPGPDEPAPARSTCNCLSPTTWAVGVACGQWFAKLHEREESRFALIEVD